jgi:hypothetical protein
VVGGVADAINRHVQVDVMSAVRPDLPAGGQDSSSSKYATGIFIIKLEYGNNIIY